MVVSLWFLADIQPFYSVFAVFGQTYPIPVTVDDNILP
jgi:hypothetical protein